MGPFATREVILLPFPFSDLSASKLRPALLLANAGKGDWVLCQITSKPYADARAITLTEADFAQGGLRLTSYTRAGKLFTAHESLFQRVAGTLQAAAHQHVVEQVVSPCCVKKRQGQKLGGLGELKTRFRRKCSSRLRWPSTQLCPGFAGNWGGRHGGASTAIRLGPRLCGATQRRPDA